MKKLFYSLFALAMTAMTFTSCEDVPAPYNDPNSNTTTPGTAIAPAGQGTEADPYNVAAALEKIKALDKDVPSQPMYVKGKIVSIDTVETAKYGNATYKISDDGTAKSQLTIYQGFYLNNVKFTSKDQIKVGDEVVIYGPFVNYKGNTPETVGKGATYIYELNGKKSTTGGNETTPSVEAKGDGTKADPYNVSAAIAKAQATNSYVKGYIVGYIYGKTIKDGARLSSDTCTVETNILLAADAAEKDLTKCMPIQLPSGVLRRALNLKEHKDYLGKEVLLYGNIASYYGQAGMKPITYAEINGTGIGNNPEEASASIFNETFATSLGNFSVVNETDPNPATATAIWQYSTKYKCAVATAFIKKVRSETNSWLISPSIDLSKVSAATLSFEQAGNYFGTGANEIKVLVSTDYQTGKPSTATWKELTLSAKVTNKDFTFIATTADLKAYAGKTGVRIAFQYTSTQSQAGTWELKNLIVK